MKPWDETWGWADRGMNPAAGARLYSDNHEEEWATTWGEDSRERARLAAQAPAMARLLLAMVSEDNGGTLPTMTRLAPDHHDTAMRCLRAAGVLDG